jgi:hypothetical protein
MTILTRRQWLKRALVVGAGGIFAPVLPRPSPTFAAGHGSWQLLSFTSQVMVVHAVLLRTGRVFFVAGSGNDPTNYPFTHGSVVIRNFPPTRSTAKTSKSTCFVAAMPP